MAPIPTKDMSHAVVAAKVNAEIGNDIRWDVIMEEIGQLVPAALLHEKRTLSKKSAGESVEDSTSAGDTTDSELSFDDGELSPKAASRPPPGLMAPTAPPGLFHEAAAPMPVAPPPGLEDLVCLPPPPGFGFERAADAEAKAAKAAKAQAVLPPWRQGKHTPPRRKQQSA